MRKNASESPRQQKENALRLDEMQLNQDWFGQVSESVVIHQDPGRH